MDHSPGPSRLMVLMFTDVADSTALKSRLGAAEFSRLLSAHDERFRRIVTSVPGAAVLKDLGDGFMATFDTASTAVQAALLFQHAVSEEISREAPRHQGIEASRGDGGVVPSMPRSLSGSASMPLRVRIGLHLGEVSDIGTDIHGQPKIIGLAADLAARLTGLALPGQILLTRTAFDDSRQYVREHPPIGSGGADQPVLTLRWMAHGPYLLKGRDEPLEVFEVGAEGIAPLKAPGDSEKARRAVRLDEEETLGWRPAAGLEIPRRSGWKLERQLGLGGFGEVWLGINQKMRERRVFKFCFDAERLRSFRREITLFRLLRESLGDRPDIARLHEVQLEQPPYYLESEYSELGNLEEWSATQGGLAKISLAHRIEIVARVADALAAAHSVGVLHKDIKPTNILMYRDASGVVQPRISDFGIGILADRAQLEGRGITIAGFTVTQLTDNSSSRTGTRMYSPPESQLGKPFTVQGDIYSLGVLLFQMAVGDLDRPMAHGWEYFVADPLLRQDIISCVQGDPAARLSSAAELSQRLRSLRSRRKSRITRRLLRIGGIVGMVYLALLCMLLWWWSHEREMRQHAETQRDRALAAEHQAAVERDRAVDAEKEASLERDRAISAEHQASVERDRALEAREQTAVERDRALAAEKRALATTDFFQEMLESVDPATAKGREVTVHDLLDQASASIGESLKGQSQVESAVRYTMGRVYFSLGDYALAEEHLKRAFELQKQLLGDDDVATMLTADALAAALIYTGKLDEAEPIAIDNLERRKRVLGPEHDQTLASMGRMTWVHQDRGRYEEAAKLHRESIEIKQRVLGPDHAETIQSYSTFADLLEDMGQLDEAEQWARQASDSSTRTLGPDDVQTLSSQSVLASILQEKGEYEQSQAICRQVLEAKTRIFGEAHANTLITQNVLALTLEAMKKYGEAAEILRKASTLAAQSLGPDHDTTLTYKGNLARAEHLRKNYDEAAKLFREVYEAHQRIDGPDDQGTLVVQNNLALLLLDMGKTEEAERLFADMVPRLDKVMPPTHWILGMARVNQGECLQDLKRYDEAQKQMLDGYSRMKSSLGEEHDRTRGAAKSLADLYQAWGKPEDEVKWRPLATPTAQ